VLYSISKGKSMTYALKVNYSQSNLLFVVKGLGCNSTSKIQRFIKPDVLLTICTC
jgi:hypothetical protein